MRHSLLFLFAGMTSLWLPSPTFATSDCALAPERSGVLQEYTGKCRNSRVHGVADVMIELPPTHDGRKRRAREFGWFEHGVPQGVHVLVLTDPEGKSPAFAILINFDASGQTNWSFGLSAKHWPKSITLLASGPWADGDGKARQAGIDYFGAKQADGTTFGDESTMIADVLNQAVEFSMVSGVQSVSPATLRHFLTSVSITQPLAGVSTGFPPETIFPDTDEAVPASRTAQNTRGTDATLQPGEIIAKTREGCGLIVQVAEEKYRQAIIDSTLRKSWLGECVDGMALGPGTLLVRTDADKISLIQRQWYFNGRPIGESTVTSFSSGSYQGSTIDAFSWEGTSFSRNTSATGTPIAQALGQNPPMVMEYSAQRKAIYTLLSSESGWPAECSPDGSACLQERILSSIPSTQNYHRCKRNDCTALWAEKVAPVLAAYETFKARHAADVEAAQKSVESILAPLLTVQKVAGRNAEVARIIQEAAGAHKADQTKVAAKAKQARIIAEKAKVAEEAAKAESRKRFWGNILSGATALAGAAVTYIEAKNGLERSSTAPTDSTLANSLDIYGTSGDALDERIRRSALEPAQPCLRESNLVNEAPNRTPYDQSSLGSQSLDSLRNYKRYSANFPGDVKKMIEGLKVEAKQMVKEHRHGDDIEIANCLRVNDGKATPTQCRNLAAVSQWFQCNRYFDLYFLTGKIQRFPNIWGSYRSNELEIAETLRNEALTKIAE